MNIKARLLWALQYYEFRNGKGQCVVLPRNMTLAELAKLGGRVELIPKGVIPSPEAYMRVGRLVR